VATKRPPGRPFLTWGRWGAAGACPTPGPFFHSAAKVPKPQRERSRRGSRESFLKLFWCSLVGFGRVCGRKSHYYREVCPGQFHPTSEKDYILLAPRRPGPARAASWRHRRQLVEESRGEKGWSWGLAKPPGPSRCRFCQESGSFWCAFLSFAMICRALQFTWLCFHLSVTLGESLE
jgi:hypothetical protein